MDKLGRLMPSDLPQMIEPLRLAKTRESISGQYDLAVMNRLGALLHKEMGTVSFGLEFGRDEENSFYCINGTIEATLTTICQRCLKSMILEIDGKIHLGLITDKSEEENLPPNYEPLTLTGKPLLLKELIEDEILLAMPIAPMHHNENCIMAGLNNTQSRTEKVNPFAMLAKLKLKK